MSEHKDQAAQNRNLTELFTVLKDIVAENPRIQDMIRLQEQDSRQVLLNMSSVLKMVEREAGGEAEDYQPKVVAGWMTPQGTVASNGDLEGTEVASAPDGDDAPPAGVSGPPVPTGDELNYFDRAFLKSLKFSNQG